MDRSLDRAVAARRPSRRVAFRDRFDAASQRDWCELIRDIVAIANSGGGVILFGVNGRGEPTGENLPELTAGEIVEELHKYVDSGFSDLELFDVTRDSHSVTALVVGEPITPIVFVRDGLYVDARGRERLAFARGSILFRRGARSVPGTTEELAEAIDRRIQDVRRSWLSAMIQLTESPVGAAPQLLPPEVRDSEAPEATPIRIVDDPTAPAYRVVDYDKTHPYRQKEILAELRSRGIQANQFDLRAVRHVYGIDANPDFSHKVMYGSRQYSPRFLNWLLEQVEANPEFFAEARRQFAPKEQPSVPESTRL